ncbi:16S rRNA (guanine527-N7)-methyltransferase [Thermanaeromonas toyohensis ToBE]|uniref:Ribosomal RNA small subunit methyltransferase G n=1 Tax=Thermanaeromonas toyohensis ToBE TaxID=698762 RepID=A0A1W1W3J3_9FIRM|nr:16S rRNA (guanine(527)-N(7))-methyltransferase RsmG [Thermanaeromonas toyohensis]SMC00189.1 16S rRNA (guanine527-N7)-methyltransferase [Thermanaeromonas toyohensis ToBE]
MASQGGSIEELRRFLEEQGLPVEASQAELLYRYGRMLKEAGESLNLSAIREEKEIWRKHFLDSLLLFFALDVPKGARVVDIGTGAGLPGLVVKIYRPDLSVTLVDSKHKKLAFVQRVLGELGLQDVICKVARAEELGQKENWRASFDLALVRAVAELRVLVEYGLPLLKLGGKLVAYKGPRAEEEVEEARRALSLVGGEVEGIWRGRLPGVGEERKIVIIRKTIPTSPAWPRRAGIPSKRPL